MKKQLIEIDDHGLSKRMANFPRELEAAQKETMDASLLTLWDNVPPYPPQPADSTYTRTGTHGRKLGSGYEGGKSVGQPSIYTVKKLGGGFEGRFGTNLEYSPYVIGDGTQAAVHKGRWYTMGDIKKKSEKKILELWRRMADKLAAFLNR